MLLHGLHRLYHPTGGGTRSRSMRWPNDPLPNQRAGVMRVDVPFDLLLRHGVIHLVGDLSVDVVP